MMFAEHLKSKGLADTSVMAYRAVVNCFQKLDVKHDDITSYNQFLIDKCLKKGKRNYNYYYALKHFIQFKFINDKVQRDFMIKNLMKPKEKTPKTIRKILTEKERYTVIINMEEKKHTIISLIQSVTGSRIADILRMKEGSIETEIDNGKEILRLSTSGKGDKMQVKYIYDKVMINYILDFIYSRELKDYIPEFYFLEYSTQKNRKQSMDEFYLIRANYERYRRDLKTSLQSSGFNMATFSTHDFRRSFSKDVYEKYNDIMILKNVLGHRDLATTQRYLAQSGLNNKDIFKDIYA